MIPNQRHLFELDPDVTYLNCAYTSPLLKEAGKAGEAALRKKANPWRIPSDDFFTGLESVRELFSRIIESDADSVALIPSVSYGIALAAKNLVINENSRIIVLSEQFPSNVYSWQRLCREKKAVLYTVDRPENSDWTSALLDAIDETASIVAVPNCHWTDGTLIDLVRVGEKCRAVGAALVVDASQSLGALPLSVRDVQPDFLIATSHKWLLGPYSLGYCYVAPKHQNGIPLEENWLNRKGSRDLSRLVDYRDEYRRGARRFDAGEASNFILTPIAEAALKRLLSWGIQDIAKTLKTKTDAIASKAMEKGLMVAPEEFRAPHMIGVCFPGGLDSRLSELLSENKVCVSIRGNAVRVAPHLYTDDGDLERLFEILVKFC